MIETVQLRHFLAVAQSLSIGPAARRLGLSPSTLAGSISVLEYQVGAPLFRQEGKEVQLTAAGRVLQAESAAILESLNQVEQHARFATERDSNTLAIAFNASAGHPAVVRVLHRFRQEFPAIDLVLQDRTTQVQRTALLTGQTDACFMYVGISERLDTRFGFQVLSSEPLVAVIPDSHPLAERSSLTLADLAREPLLVAAASLSPPVRSAILAEFSIAGIQPRSMEDVPSVTAAYGMINLGRHIGFVPSGMQSIGGAHLLFRPIVATTQRVFQALLWNAEHPAPAVAQLRQSALATLAESYG